MFRYIVRRLLYMIPVILGISIIAFITMYAAGDPISLIRAGKPNITQATIESLASILWIRQTYTDSIFELACKHLAVEFWKIALRWATCKPHNWTKDLANNRTSSHFTPNCLRDFHTNCSSFSKKTLLKTRRCSNLILSLWGFNANFLVWAYTNNSVLIYVWLATLCRGSRGCRICVVGQSRYLTKLRISFCPLPCLSTFH